MVGVQKSGPAAPRAVRSCSIVHDVRRILGRRRHARVLEVVDAGDETAPNLFRAVRVRDDGKPALVRFVDDGAHFVHRHLVLVDQLDDVHAGVRELPHFRARVVGAVHAPAEIVRCPDRARAE